MSLSRLLTTGRGQICVSAVVSAIVVSLAEPLVLSDYVLLQKVGATLLVPGFAIALPFLAADIHGGTRLGVATLIISWIMYTGGLYLILRFLARRKRTRN